MLFASLGLLLIEVATPLTDPNWTLEWLKIAQGLCGTLVGGALVLLGSWLSDRRRDQNEDLLRDQRESAILTGMFAVITTGKLPMMSEAELRQFPDFKGTGDGELPAR